MFYTRWYDPVRHNLQYHENTKPQQNFGQNNEIRRPRDNPRLQLDPLQQLYPKLQNNNQRKTNIIEIKMIDYKYY